LRLQLVIYLAILAAIFVLMRMFGAPAATSPAK
jgi:hypothetical protein